MFSALEQQLLALAHIVPLELFVLIASFIEEVIAPIPSPSIMVMAGSAALIQNYTHEGLATLVVLASVGKTLGGLTMYWIASRLKDFALSTPHRYIPVTKADIDTFAQKFTGSFRDYLLYILFRSVPIIPSVILSFGSGVIRLPLRLFIIGTFIGTLVRDTFYILVGYQGTEYIRTLLSTTERTESVVQILIGIGVLIGIGYLFIQKRRSSLTTSRHSPTDI